MNDSELIERFLTADRLALAKMLTRVENDQSVTDPVLDQVLTKIHGAYRIGITGPPGAGKSTLVDGLIQLLRKDNKTVGVIAVDPTSPFTGGALLGDRIRMNSNIGDNGVFIRSMATRGSLGGLSFSTQEAGDVMDAFGFDIILMETVGVGQSELDVVGAADSTVVVLVPESGDSIQAMKAGLMEIGDIFVLNKSDHSNAEQAFVEIQSILSLNPARDNWQLPVIQTIAHEQRGLPELLEQIQAHYNYLKKAGRLAQKRLQRIKERLRAKINRKLQTQFWNDSQTRLFEQMAAEIQKGTKTYNDALEQLFKKN